jgi:integration host factor subunit alpha
MTVTRKELAKPLGDKSSFPVDRSVEVMDEAFEIMQETPERGEKIKIAGFGNFIVRQKRARIGRNPKTGDRMQISRRRVVTFMPSPILRKALNEGGE